MKGHVRKRGNKWCFVLDIGQDPGTGKRRQKWFSGYRTKREAERAMAEKLSEIARGDFVEPQELTVEELIKIWLDNHGHSLSVRTFDTYRYLAETHVFKYIGHLSVNELAPIHLQQMYTNLLLNGRKDGKGGLSPTSVRRVHQLCFAALRWAKQMRMVNRNVAEDVTPPKKAVKEMKTWTAGEMWRFLEAAKEERLYALFYLACSTGMRQGELLGLKWSDIDLKQGIIRIQRVIQRNSNGLVVKEQPKTSRSRRSVNISPATTEVLKQHKRKVDKEMLLIGKKDVEWVFPNSHGNIQEPRKVIHVFHRIIKRADVPKIRFHDLRHTRNPAPPTGCTSKNCVGTSWTRQHNINPGHIFARNSIAKKGGSHDV